MIVGIIGGGQLGMMMADAANKLGHSVISYHNTLLCPIKRFSKMHYVGEFNNLALLEEFCFKCDVITYEFENINYETIKYLGDLYHIVPNYKALRYSQNRLLEKQLANKLCIKTCVFKQIFAIEEIDFSKKSIVKSIFDGYDGKNQALVEHSNQDLIKELLQNDCILEEYIDYDFEVSVLVNKDFYNNIFCFPITKNFHVKGILQKSIVPVNLSEKLKTRLIENAILLVQHLDIVGSLAVEFFVKNNDIYFNEMAPRPHNSFHHTLESCNVSQFTQHINCITNKKISEPVLLSSACMVNIIGTNDVGLENGFLHMYGKTVVRKNRKMGHITFIGGEYE